MRSSSVAMYWMPIRRRRSRATGCWVAMTMKICSRICLKSSFRYWSCDRTFSADAPSRRRSASREASICAPTTGPMRTSDALRLASSLANVRRGMSCLAEAPGDVSLCPRVPRCVEEIGRGGELDQLAVPPLGVHEHESSEVGDARGLLHVVRDDYDRVVARQLHHEVLDLQGGYGIERGAGLVHEDHLRAHGQAPRDHEPLLLAARERRGGFIEAVRDLIP